MISGTKAAMNQSEVERLLTEVLLYSASLSHTSHVGYDLSLWEGVNAGKGVG